MKLTLPLITLSVVVVSGVGKEEPNTHRISLSKIGGRHLLLDSEGNPFFAHGITHASNRKVPFDLKKFSAKCREVGFNSYGYGCPEELRSDMPYLESWNNLVPISYYRGKGKVQFIDIFDPKVKAKLEAGVKASCQRSKKNPQNLIGYCWTDLASWPLENPSGQNWVQFTRSLPAETPGKIAYQKFLDQWEGKDEQKRDLAFLRLIAREYFKTVGRANRKHDPDALVFGDRFAFNTLVPEVLEEMLPYVDAIAIQPQFWGPFPKKKFDEIYKLSKGKPIILCDFAIRFDDGSKDIRSWRKEPNPLAAGKAYSDYVKAALATDYILGVFWCNPVDTPKGFGKPGVKQGFFGDGLTSRLGLHDAVRKLNLHLKAATVRRKEESKEDQ